MLQDSVKVKGVITKFDTYAIGELNETNERYMFKQRKQALGESFDVYLANLQKL